MRRNCLFCWYIAISVSLLFTGARSYAQTTSDTTAQELNKLVTRFSAGEELIVTLRVGNLEFGEIFVLVNEQGAYTNLDELNAIFEFPIKPVTKSPYQLDGWFIRQSNNFNLTMFDQIRGDRIGQVTVGGKEFPVTDAAYENLANEHLFNLEDVASWYGFSMSVDEANLILLITPSELLPVQRKMARQNRNIRARTKNEAQYPVYELGYYHRSHQMIDASLRANFSEDDSAYSYSVIGRQDLAGLASRFFVSGTNQDTLSAGEVSFGRQSSDGKLLGPLGVTNIEFGDIRAVRSSANSTGQQLGISLNNDILGNPFESEITNISGLVQNGWDVELYQNKVLIGQQLDIQNGRYDFLDIPLFVGLNTFEVVKYGPQGQTEREVIEKNTDLNLFPDKIQYGLSLTKQNTSVFGLSDSDEEMGYLLSGRYAKSINDWLSASFTHAVGLGDTIDPDQYGLSFATKVSARTYGNFSFSSTSDNQHSFTTGVRTRMGEQYFGFSLAQGFNGKDPTSKNLSLSASGTLLGVDLGELSYSSTVNHNWTDSDNYRQTIGANFTLGLGWATISQFNRINNIKAAGVLNSTRSGGINIGGRHNNLSYRLSAIYDFTDALEWTSATAGLNYRVTPDIYARLDYQYSLVNNTDSFAISADWRRPSYALNARLSHGSTGTNLSLNARMSLSEAPTASGYIQSNRSLTSGGIVIVRAFHDVNNNFIFDADDIPLEGVKVKADQSNKSAKTNAQGEAVLSGVGTFVKTDLSIERGTLQDPYLLQSTINTSLEPRDGLLAMVNYPFIEGAEFEGTVVVTDQYGRELPLSSTEIELYNSLGAKVGSIKSEFDGYFYSGIVFPDTYEIKLSEASLERFNIKQSQRVFVELSKPGGLVADITINAVRLDEVNAFQSIVREFSSERAARAYAKILRVKYESTGLMSDVFVQSEPDQGHLVVAGAFATQVEAESQCDALTSVQVNCRVSEQVFYR